MVSFPKLKTGAVAQYPVARELRFSTQVLEFVDGREQRYRDFASTLRRWVIRLDLLDAGEMAAVTQFFDDAGVVSTFAFTDPQDGKTYANCSVDSPEIETEFLDEWRGRTQLRIRENRT